MTNVFEDKYEVIEKIGEGSFSEVLKVEDRDSNLQYAAKRLKKRFKSVYDVLYCAEIIATQKLCRHPNVLYMLEYIYDSFGGKVVFIFELMDMSMYEYMKIRKRLPESKVKIYLYQMLKGLEHLHNNGLFHRDIKPENILVKLPANSHDTSVFEGELVKLADLGSIRGIYSQPPYTEYISTRWYRSPECLLTVGNYGSKMDVWAVGCVFYEMLTMKPLFPGANEIDQLSKIHALLGTPSNRLLCKFKKRSKNFENFPTTCGSGLGPLLCNITENSQILLKLMLQYDPEARSNVKRLLENKYFYKMREDECYKKYKIYDIKTNFLKKGHGDQGYLHQIGSSNNWKNSKFQNSKHGGYLIPTKKPSVNQQTPNAKKELRTSIKEHAATTGNLRKEYDFNSNTVTHPINNHQRDQHPFANAPSIQHQPLQQPQKMPDNIYAAQGHRRVHALTDQILLGQQLSGVALGGGCGAGYAYGYGPPGAQGARMHVAEGAPAGKQSLRKPMPGGLCSRTTVDLPSISQYQLQRSLEATHQQYHHQTDTISTMIKQKPPVKNKQPHNQNNRLIDKRTVYIQGTLRGESKGSKGSKSKAKSNNSSKTGSSGKGTVKKTDKCERVERYGGWYKRHRSKSGHRLVEGSLQGGKKQQQGRHGVTKRTGSPVGIGDGNRKALGLDTLAPSRGGGVRNLRKRAASKSPEAIPSKHVGVAHNQRDPSNSYSGAGAGVHRWSDLKRQSGECHKQLDVAPLPACRMNIGQNALYKGHGAMGVTDALNIGVYGRGDVFRKTTSNLPQLAKKPVLPGHSYTYNNSVGREFQSRSFVLPKRQQGRQKQLDTIVELQDRGGRKLK